MSDHYTRFKYNLNTIRYIFLAVSILVSALMLTGCSKEDKALSDYKAAMTAFTERIQGLVSDIEAIDTEDDQRTVYLLQYLDEMDDAFSEMAALEVPVQFISIESLADEASANLSRAVSLYHQAFDGEESSGYDISVVNAAQEYYSRAFLRLSYIGTILQGKVPDDDNITIIYENEEEDGPIITDPADEAAPTEGDGDDDETDPETVTEDEENTVG